MTLHGIGSAAPAGVLTAKRSGEIMAGLLSREARDTARIKAAIRLSGVEERHTVLMGDGGDLALYTERPAGGAPIPGTAERMAVFARAAPALALEAARRALGAARMEASCIRHVVVVSCTGFFSPGLDLALIKSLGLGPEVTRTLIGFMGCHGAVNAMAAAQAFASQVGEGAVLAVCVELCSLHLQHSLERDALVPNVLFADGAAALVVSSAAPRAGAPAFRLMATATHAFPGSAQAMTWTITDAGFRMTLDSCVPDLIREGIREPLESFLRSHGVAMGDVAAWAIHPGGPKVLESAGMALGIREEQMTVSREVLRTHGNMSSATLLFILERLGVSPVRGWIVALAFGPGLVAEMALLEAL